VPVKTAQDLLLEIAKENAEKSQNYGHVLF
jgi:hypothetical protein